MFKVVTREYGSNGVEQEREFVFNVPTQEDIVRVMWEYEEADYTDFEDHPEIVSVTPLCDDILDAGGTAGEFVAIYQDDKEVAPIYEVVNIFE